MTEIIKDGYLSVKEEGLRAWIWSKRFCVLRDQALTFHRNEVRKRIIDVMAWFLTLLIAIWTVCSVDLPERDQFSDKNRTQALLFRDCCQRQDILYCMQE